MDPEDHPDTGPSEATYRAVIGCLMRKLRYFGTQLLAEDLRAMRLADVEVTPQKNGDVIVTVD